MDLVVCDDVCYRGAEMSSMVPIPAYGANVPLLLTALVSRDGDACVRASVHRRNNKLVPS
jgi:hypothetical protein